MSKPANVPDRLAEALLGPWTNVSRCAYAIAIALLCAGLFIVGWRITGQTNPDAGDFDQSAYISMAREMKGSWYPWYTDGTRNPLFPWLAASLLDADAPDFFQKGKRLNVVLAVAGTAILAGFFACRLGPLPAFTATALSAMGALLPIGTFFGAEAVYYVLFFFLFVCAMRLLNENPLWLYLLLGLLAAVAWLAKPSASPFLALFVGISAVRLVLSPLMRAPGCYLAAPDWRPGRLVLGMLVFGGIYFALIAPRLVHAQRSWGNAFYSLPSCWFWADDWETCVRQYRDCRSVRLAELPADQQPTLAGYFRRHSWQDAARRLTYGTGVRLKQFFHPEGKWLVEKPGRLKRLVLPHRGFYVLGLAALAASLAAMAVGRGRLSQVGPVVLPVLLAAGTFTGFLLAAAWYLPIGPGHRFVMMLYIPALWLLIQGGEQLRRATLSRAATAIALATHLVIAGLLASRLVMLVSSGNFEKIPYAF